MNIVERVVANIDQVTKTIVFVGAGLSVKSGMRSWKDSMDEVIAECRLRKRDEAEILFFELLMRKEEYPVIAELIYDQAGSVLYQNIMEKVFRRNVSPVEEHRLLIKTPFAGLVTTNFDKLVEVAHSNEKGGLPFVQQYDLDGVKRLMSWDRFFLFKMHGDIDNIDTIVLRKSQYSYILSRVDIAELFRKYMLSFQVLFLGYSFRDPDFRSIWTVINQSSRLRAPGVLAAQKGAFPPEAIANLRDMNLHVFEPDTIDEDFSFVRDSLRALCDKSSGMTVSSPAVELDEDELLQTSLVLLGLFDEGKADHFGKFIKSIVISFLLKPQSEPVDARELYERISDLLSVDSDRIREEVEHVVLSLQQSGVLQQAGNKFLIRNEHRDSYKTTQANFENEIELALNSALRRVCSKDRRSADPGDIELLKSLLFKLVQEQGRALAEGILFYRRMDTEEQQFAPRILSFLHERNADSKKDLVLSVVREMVNNATEQEERVLFRLLQMFFLTNSFALNYSSEKLLKAYVQQFVAYFDSNILLQAMAEGHPNHEISMRVIEKTRSLGIKPRVLDVIKNEIESHAELAVRKFSELTLRGVNIGDAVSAYVQLVGTRMCNVFLLGYNNLLRARRQLRWADYMSPFVTVTNEKILISREKIESFITSKLEIEVSSSTFEQNELVEIERLTREIATLRKFGHRFVNDILCKDEASQFLLIYKERAADTRMRDKVWWITNDHFVTDIFNKNRDKYVLPCSYTPLGWYQYLQLVDFDARASKNFSKLFAFSEVGALDDDLAIETIRMMLTKESDLLKKGAASVSEFANELVSKYHIKAVFDDYARAKRQGSASKRQFQQRIEQTVQTAFEEYVAVRKVDLKNLESTKAELAKEKRRLETEKFKRKQVTQLLRTLQTRKPKRKGGKRKRS